MSRLLVTSVIALSTALCRYGLAQSGNSSNSIDTNLYPRDTPGESHAKMDLRIPGRNPDGWLYPITQLDQSLPHWVQFGGQFRDRVESQDALSYKKVNDTYDLTQLRLGIYIQPTSWLQLVGVTQDARVFFNHQAATGPPY
jgi:hypothetical protein